MCCMETLSCLLLFLFLGVTLRNAIITDTSYRYRIARVPSGSLSENAVALILYFRDGHTEMDKSCTQGMRLGRSKLLNGTNTL